jgi:predicted double-glycine peptidase
MPPGDALRVKGMFSTIGHTLMRLRCVQPQGFQVQWSRRKEPLGIGLITILLGVSLLLCAPPQLAAGEVEIFLPGGGIFTKQVTSYKERRMQQMVPQTSDYSCGAAAMATLLHYQFGQEVTEKDAILGMFEHGDKEGIQKRGFSMLDMKRFALSRGLRAEGYKISNVSSLESLKNPVVTLIQTARYKHFVVIRGIDQRFVYLSDPSWGNRKMPLGEFMNTWDHVILVVSGPVKGSPQGLYNEAEAAGLPKDWVIRNDDSLGGCFAIDPSRAMFTTFQSSQGTLTGLITSTPVGGGR